MNDKKKAITFGLLGVALLVANFALVAIGLYPSQMETVFIILIAGSLGASVVFYMSYRKRSG